MIRISTLPNGLRVLTETMTHVRSATVGVWCDVGSAVEPPERRGISHLLEHMLFKGTPRRSAREIAEVMDAVGGELNAMTDKETTCFYAHVVDRRLPLAIDVLADMLQHALIDPGDLARERQVVLEEIKMYDDSPGEVVNDRFSRTLWRGAHLGDPTIGYAHTVEGITRDDLLAWRRDRYSPQTVFITAAGNLDHDDVVRLAAGAFARFGGSAAPPVPERPHFTPDLDVTIDDTEQAYVLLGMPGLALRDERRYALSVLDTILGGGMSSRLFQSVREERALAYEISTFQQGYRDAGLYGVSAGCTPERVQECVDVVLDEIDRLLDDGVREAEVERAREHLKGNLTLALESTFNRMSRLARNHLVHGRQIATEEVEAQFDAVDVHAVDTLARELFGPAQRGLCVLGPSAVRSVRLRGAAAA
ncbi:putative zinc protease [Vulcanimicrobium alpinum]|uniref:Zinc protease n=1 Tax=Vulcanimicrobium alpinum TaxID=3016050 RepID=A0AAN1XVS2_UNVUL|nr:pitrilysin family protein [Vulcanimicrobium alpinum]BDE06317.1 putative zinc protease [Vulcanimicrobium alpinum]